MLSGLAKKQRGERRYWVCSGAGAIHDRDLGLCRISKIAKVDRIVLWSALESGLSIYDWFTRGAGRNRHDRATACLAGVGCATASR